MKTAKELTNDITNYVNSFNKGKEFCEAMSSEHRTLQQSFTRLCFEWLQHCASDEYQTDRRNEATHNISKEIMGMWKEKLIKMGYSESTLEDIKNPSKWLPYV